MHIHRVAKAIVRENSTQHFLTFDVVLLEFARGDRFVDSMGAQVEEFYCVFIGSIESAFEDLWGEKLIENHEKNSLTISAYLGAQA